MGRRAEGAVKGSVAGWSDVVGAQAVTPGAVRCSAWLGRGSMGNLLCIISLLKRSDKRRLNSEQRSSADEIKIV